MKTLFERVGIDIHLMSQQVMKGERISFYRDLMTTDKGAMYIYDLMYKRSERVVSFFPIHRSERFETTFSGVWKTSFVSTATARSTLRSCFRSRTTSASCRRGCALRDRYPKQSAVLDAIGTPCILRPDLRTSFLTYYGRGVNTAIRRYEFGYVFKSLTNCGGDSSYQYPGSVDNGWLQP